jgi:hypothetical protein
MASYQILPREQVKSKLPGMQMPKAVTVVDNAGQPQQIVKLDQTASRQKRVTQPPEPDPGQSEQEFDVTRTRDRRVADATRPHVVDQDARNDGDLDAAIAKYNEAVQRVPKNSNSKLASFLKMLGHGAAQAFGGRPARDWNEFYSGLARIGVTGVSGLVHPEWDEAIQREHDIDASGRDVEGMLKVAGARSTIRSRDSMADYRQSKLEMDSAYRRFLVSDKARRTDGYLTRLEFLNEYGDQLTTDRRHKQKWLEETEETREAGRAATRKLAGDRFDYRKERDKLSYELQKRRTAAYERSVQNNANKQDASILADQAESDYLENRADEYEDKAAELEATGDPEDEVEARQLRSAARTARDKAASRGYRGNANSAARGNDDALKSFNESQVRAFGKSKNLKGPQLEAFVNEWRQRAGISAQVTGGASGSTRVP